MKFHFVMKKDRRRKEMNQQKIIAILLITIFVLGGLLVGKSYAALSGRIELRTESKTVIRDEEFSIFVRVSNLQAGKGIIALGGTLDYDRGNLELKEIEGENRWASAEPNENNGKFVSTRSKRMTEDGDVLKLTFLAKGNAGQNAWVRISNFEISDGNEEMMLNGTSINISIQNKVIEPPQEEEPVEPDPPQQTETTTKKPTTTTTKKPSTTTQEPQKVEETTVPETPIEPENPDNSILANFAVSNTLLLNTVEHNTIGLQNQVENLAIVDNIEQQNTTTYLWMIIIGLSCIVIILVIVIVIYRKKI